MQKNKKRVIIALAVIVCFMAVGYALLSQELTINGNSKITADWNVQITGIKASPISGGQNMDATFTSPEEPTFNATSATFNAALPMPGSGVGYLITIENKGSIDAVLTEEPVLDTINSQEPTEVIYSLTYNAEGSTAAEKGYLAAGEKAQYAVMVQWSKDATSIPETKEKTATITFDYVQDAAQDGKN